MVLYFPILALPCSRKFRSFVHVVSLGVAVDLLNPADAVKTSRCFVPVFFIQRHVRSWIRLDFIRPCKPCKGKRRDERSNLEVFFTLAPARSWRDGTAIYY